MSLLINFETLIASSMRFELRSGPSITSTSASKFHLVWSLVVMTYRRPLDVHHNAKKSRKTNLSFEQRILEGPVIHLHPELYSHLFDLTFDLTLSSTHRILD